MLSKNEEIIGKSNKCLDYAGGRDFLGINDQIHLLDCHNEKGNQRWLMLDDNSIRHNSGYCLELKENDPSELVMAECNSFNQRQKWAWKKKLKFSNKVNFLDLV